MASFEAAMHCAVRRLHTATRAARQRSPATPSRPSRKWSVQPSSPTFRPPTQNLLSPFGSVLHGPTRGPQATFAEPLDAWLAVLADTVPFYKDCLLVCPSSSTEAELQRVWQRCREHIPTAHLGALRPRTTAQTRTTSSSASKPSEAAASHSDIDRAGGPAPAPAVATGTEPASSAALRSRPPLPPVPSTRPLPALHSPLENVAAHSLDLVVFPLNVFAHEMLFDAPWHLSLAHRALRPHGVIAIVGHVMEAELAAPTWAQESAAECIAGLHEEVTRDLELADDEAVRRFPLSDLHVRRVRRAIEVQETLRTAHGDVFFPFPGVRRRWFTSEYAMHPAEVTAHYRAAPLYQALYGTTGSLWRRNAEMMRLQRQDEGRQSLQGGSGSGGDDDDFFVDLTVDHAAQSAASAQLSSGAPHGTVQPSSPLLSSASRNSDDAALVWTPPGVQRRRSLVDPLDALQAILEAHLVRAQTGANAAAEQQRTSSRHLPSRTEPPLRVQMRHFVVTCSSRSMNATPEFDSPRIAAPGSGGRPRLS